MLDGTYTLTVKIPFKKVTGTLTLITDADEVIAVIDAMGSTIKTTGTYEDDTFTFKGALDTPFGNVSYTINGYVAGEELRANCATSMGTYKAQGKRLL